MPSSTKRPNLRVTGWLATAWCCVLWSQVAPSESVGVDVDAAPRSNATLANAIFESVADCLGRSRRHAESGSSCLKRGLYRVGERYLRDKLAGSLSDEERAELLRYQPLMKRMIRVLEKGAAAAATTDHGSWLDAKITDQLASLVDESSDDNEGRKKKNKGLGQMIMFSVISGLAVALPLVFKVIAAMAAKALIASKVAMIISAMLYFNKLAHHDHDSVHETSIRRQTMI